MKWGGAEQACYRLATLLAGKGHDVSVLTTKSNGYRKEAFNLFNSTVSEDYVPMKLKKIVTSIKNTILPYDFFSKYHSSKIFYKFRPDVIHLHNFTSLSFSVISKAADFKIPVFLSAYDYWFICPLGFLWYIDDYLNYSGSNCNRYHGIHCNQCIAKMKGFGEMTQNFLLPFLYFRKTIFDRYLSRISGFVVLSEANAKVLTDYGIDKNKIFVVHIPLNITGECDINNIEKDSILYIGWFHPRKGMHVCVESMKYIVRNRADAKLYIIGADFDERYKKKVLQIIKDNNLERKVSILGKLPFETVREYLSKANVLVIPEQWETIAPNALTEGMVFGKAVVASNIGGNLDVIRNGINGLLAKHDDPQEYSEKVLSILDNEDLRLRLSKEAFETGKKLFSNDIVYKELLESYQKAIKAASI